MPHMPHPCAACPASAWHLQLQFVDATKLLAADSRYRDTNFAVAALQEIPEQFAAILRLRLLSKLG